MRVCSILDVLERSRMFFEQCLLYKAYILAQTRVLTVPLRICLCCSVVRELADSFRKSIVIRSEISLYPTFQVPATIADKLLGVVSRYITVHCNKYVEKHQRVVQKIPVLTLN